MSKVSYDYIPNSFPNMRCKIKIANSNFSCNSPHLYINLIILYSCKAN